jgi:putative transposase
VVSPALWREVVAWAQRAYRLSERRAVKAVGASLSTVRYRSVKAPREPLRRRIREVAEARTSWGYRQIHTVLRQGGLEGEPQAGPAAVP